MKKKITKTVVCPRCRGCGDNSFSHEFPCNLCRGKRMIIEETIEEIIENKPPTKS